MADGWFGALIFFLVLQIVASVLRYATRGFLVKRFGWDDLASLITLSISIVLCAVQIHILVTVGDKSAADLLTSDYDLLIEDGNLEFGNLLLYGLGTMALKLTVGLFYLRLFTKKSLRITTYIMMAIATSFGLVYFFFCLFQCGTSPMIIHKIVIYIIAQKCFTYNTIAGIQYTQAALTAIIDLVYVILAILHIRSVQLDRKTKWSVGGILCLGSAGGILTFVRIAWIKYWLVPKITFFQTSEPITVLSIGELSIGITCLALTTYKPLFKLVSTQVTKIRSSSSQDSDATLRPAYNDSEKKTYNSNSTNSEDRKYMGGSNTFSDRSNNTTLISAERERYSLENVSDRALTASDLTSMESRNGFREDLERGHSPQEM